MPSIPSEYVEQIQCGNYPTFAETRSPVVFVGLAPYIQAAGDAAGLSQEMTGLARGGWHTRAAQSALGAIPDIAAKVAIGHMPEANLDGVMARIADVRGSLAAQLAGLDAAIAEIYGALGIQVPKPIKSKPRG